MSIYIIIFLWALSGAAIGAPNPKEAKGAKAGEAVPGSVKHKVLSFELEGLTDSGEKKWEVKGQSAEAVSENEIKLNNIVARSYGDEAQATITADKGVYDKSKNSVRLEDNVNAQIETTKGLGDDYLSFPDQLTGSAQMPGKETSGDRRGRESAAAKKAGETQKKTKTVITCDGEVEFNYEQNLAYFDKNVKVVSADGNIDADKITVHLDPATKKIKEIVAEGNVKIIRGENITYSEKATYVEQDKKIVLTGRPKLVIYQEGNIEDNLF